MDVPIKKDVNIYRGDASTITFSNLSQFVGDVLHFVVKAERNVSDVTTVVLFEKIVTVTGANISVEIENSDTADITLNKLVYDLYDITREKTLYTGEINLLPDVTSPFDGYTVPLKNRKVVCVDVTHFADNDMLIVKTINGIKYFVPISLSQLKQLLDNL